MEKSTKRATGCLPNDFATPDATVSPHSTNSYYLVPDKRDKEAKSTSRVAGRSAQHTRPKSQLDTAANSLWRIKSDIQLNLSQAMGKIRLKVSSGASPPATNDECESSSSGAISSDTAPEPKKLDQKARSTFYLPTMAPVDAATTKNIVSPHPTSISITLEAGLADELISSTAASSDEDEDDENDDTVWSGELETQRRDSGNASDDITPVAAGVGAPNLPDLVPQRVQKKVVVLIASHSLCLLGGTCDGRGLIFFTIGKGGLIRDHMSLKLRLLCQSSNCDLVDFEIDTRAAFMKHVIVDRIEKAHEWFSKDFLLPPTIKSYLNPFMYELSTRGCWKSE